MCNRCGKRIKQDPHSGLLTLTVFNPKNMNAFHSHQFALCEECTNLILEVLDNPTIEA